MGQKDRERQIERQNERKIERQREREAERQKEDRQKKMADRKAQFCSVMYCVQAVAVLGIAGSGAEIICGTIV